MVLYIFKAILQQRISVYILRYTIMSAFYQTYYRCLIDAGFGRIKQKYRLEDTDTVDHIASVVERSSTSNVPVLYGQWEWRAWKEFLGDRFKKVPAINSYYYFRFESSDPGAVYMRQSAVSTTETRFVICKTPLLEMDAENIPRVIPPAGLSDERRR